MAEAVKTTLALIKKDIKEIIKDVSERVTLLEFTPVKNIVYGLVGVILVSFIGCLIALVWK